MHFIKNAETSATETLLSETTCLYSAGWVLFYIAAYYQMVSNASESLWLYGDGTMVL